MDSIKSFVFPNSGSQPDDGVAWWMKYLCKAAGILSGIGAIMFGVMVILSPFPTCIIAGVWQVCAGFIMIVCEAPFCCSFIGFVRNFSDMIENRPPWQKTILYVVIALPPLFLCLGFSSLLGSCMLGGTGVLYGMQVFGKKGGQSPPAAQANTEPDEKNILDEGEWGANP